MNVLIFEVEGSSSLMVNNGSGDVAVSPFKVDFVTLSADFVTLSSESMTDKSPFNPPYMDIFHRLDLCLPPTFLPSAIKSPCSSS